MGPYPMTKQVRPKEFLRRLEEGIPPTYQACQEKLYRFELIDELIDVTYSTSLSQYIEVYVTFPFEPSRIFAIVNEFRVR